VGLPTVAFDTPVAQEYLGPDGLFACRGSAESLADRLSAPLAHPALAAQAGTRLRRRAVEQYDWQHAGQTIVEAYAAVSKHDRRTPQPARGRPA
jgi:glycosyltransferase involved in cell wall biosynthesis